MCACACVSIAARFKPNPAPIVQLSLSDCTKISSRRLGVSKYLSRFNPSLNPAPIVQSGLRDCTEISSWRLGAGCETSSIPPFIMYLGWTHITA